MDEIEARSENLSTTFLIHKGRIISENGKICSQDNDRGRREMEICKFTDFNTDWKPYSFDYGEKVRIMNTTLSKCIGYNARTDLLENPLEEVDCNGNFGTLFYMIYPRDKHRLCEHKVKKVIYETHVHV